MCLVKRVYLVEDSELLRTQIIRALEESGVLRVIGSATRADVAVQEIAALRPDITVVDLQLERGTGWDVIEQAAGSAGELIVLTNLGSEVFRATAEARGVADFFDKTTEFDRFLTRLGVSGV